MIGVLTSVRYYISEPERAIIAKYCLRLQGICFSVISFQSSDPWFYSWAKPDSYWSAQDRLNDGWVKLFQQLLWPVKLPQLVNEGQPFVGLFFFYNWCECPNSGPERWWIPGTYMSPLQSQYCLWCWVGRVQGGFSWSPRSSPLFWACWAPGCLDCTRQLFKGIVHPKIKILSSFTHPQVVPKVYTCLCSAEHKGGYSEECGNRAVLGHYWLT